MPNHKGTRRRLSENERDQIRKRYLAGVSAREIATSMNSSQSMIWLVVRGLIANRNRDEYESASQRVALLPVEDRHWIAGIVDGEGWIGVGANKTFNGPRVSVSSVDDVMAPTLHRLLGGSLCRKRALAPNRRDQWSWDAFTLPLVRAICEGIGPSLRVKNQQAKILAAYCESRMVNRSKKYTQTEQGLVAELRCLNRRGRSHVEVCLADQEHVRP